MPASAEERITFICSACNARLKVPARHAGVTGPCPKCNATITAPAPKAAVEVVRPTFPQQREVAPEPKPTPALEPQPTIAAPAAQAQVQAQQPPAPINQQPPAVATPTPAAQPAAAAPPVAESPTSPRISGNPSAQAAVPTPGSTPAAAPNPATAAPQFPAPGQSVDQNANTIAPTAQVQAAPAPTPAPAEVPSARHPAPDPGADQAQQQQPNYSPPQPAQSQSQPPQPAAASPNSFDPGSANGGPAQPEVGMPAVVPPWLTMPPANGAGTAPTQPPASNGPDIAPPVSAHQPVADPFSNSAPPAATEQSQPAAPSPAAPAQSPATNPGFPTAAAAIPVQEPAPAPAEPTESFRHEPMASGGIIAGGQAGTPEIRLAPSQAPPADLSNAAPAALASPPPSPAQFGVPPAAEAPVQHAAAAYINPPEPVVETVEAAVVEPLPVAPFNRNEASPPAEPLAASPQLGAPPVAAAPSEPGTFQPPVANNPFDANAQSASPPVAEAPQAGEVGGAPSNPFQPPVANAVPEVGAPGGGSPQAPQSPDPTSNPAQAQVQSQPQVAQQSAFQPPAHPVQAAQQRTDVPNLTSAPNNLPPFGSDGKPISPSPTGGQLNAAPSNEAPSPFATPGAADPSPRNLPQSRSFDPLVGPPQQAGEPFANSAAPHNNPMQGLGPGAAAATGLADVPENPQPHPDLDSFVQAAAQSEKEARDNRKPGRYGKVARILTITIGLCVALVSLLFIDHKQDGIAVLHKIPGFGALSDKFSGMLAPKSDDNANPNGGPGSGDGTGTSPLANGGGGTPSPAPVGPGTPPASDAQLTINDATDNGEQTIPLNPDTLSTNTLNNDAGTRSLVPGGAVSTTDPRPGPALETGGSPGAAITNPAAGVNPTADPMRTDITPGVDNANSTVPNGGAASPAPATTANPGGGPIVLAPPGQVGNGNSGTNPSATPPAGSVGSPGSVPAAGPGAGVSSPAATPLKATPLPDNTAVLPATQTGDGPLKSKVPVESELAEPRRAVTNYLNAANWQARIPLIYEGNKLKSKVEGYYASNPDTAVSPYDLEFFHMEEGTGPGRPYYIYFVSTPTVPQGFPAIVRRTSDGLKLDWECFVEFHDSHFVKFHDNKEEGPKSFRVVLKRVEYWGEDRNQFTDLDDYICYGIELPYAEIKYYAFVPRDQPLATELQGMVDWGKAPLAGIITFKRENFAHGVSHLKITDFVTEDWFRPVD